MSTFRYRAYGASGQLAEGSIEAISENAAQDLLWTQGLTTFDLRAAGGGNESWWQRDLFSTAGKGRRTADLTSFTREFATLNAADVPLDDALRILCEQAGSSTMKALSESLLADILDGATLSDAMQKRAHIFPADYVSVVRAGEVGGTVGQVFGELAMLLERRAEVRAKIQSALTYPIILIGLSIVSLAVVVGGLVPSIAPIFAENGRQMPLAMRSIVTLEAHWREILFAAIALAGLLAIAAIAISRHPARRLACERWVLRLPLYGGFALRRETARFARTLGTLLRAGVPLIQAATSSRSVISNGYFGAGMDRAIDAIREGAPLHRALRSESAFPVVALRIIAIGEEAGKLDRMLLRLAEMLEQQAQHSVDRFMSILTPALTIAIAAIIGGLIMTVVSAILSINDIAFQ